MEVTINITELENLTAAMNSLAAAIAGNGNAVQAQPVQAAVQPAPVQMPAQQMVAQPAPMQMPVQQAPVQQTPVQMPVQQAPVQQAPVQPVPVQQAVPTSAPTYTLDDLARAAMGLMDSGRQIDLQQLLARFGVEALPLLPQQQYGAFATALREMGAQI